MSFRLLDNRSQHLHKIQYRVLYSWNSNRSHCFWQFRIQTEVASLNRSSPFRPPPPRTYLDQMIWRRQSEIVKHEKKNRIENVLKPQQCDILISIDHQIEIQSATILREYPLFSFFYTCNFSDFSISSALRHHIDVSIISSSLRYF